LIGYITYKKEESAAKAREELPNKTIMGIHIAARYFYLDSSLIE
jgi:hypothetical protein